MQPTDFVFQQIYKGALIWGALESAAHNCAVMGLDDLKKGKFKKGGAAVLIADYIKQAKKK